MKKFSIVLVALLSIVHAPFAFGCIGWASGLVSELTNKHGLCSDLPTPEEREKCYTFKQEYAQFWAAAVAELQKCESKPLGDSQMLLDSVALIRPQFENIEELIAALQPGNEKAHAAEAVLACIAAYHANNSKDDCFSRVDIVFIAKTKAGLNTPKCR